MFRTKLVLSIMAAVTSVLSVFALVLKKKSGDAILYSVTPSTSNPCTFVTLVIPGCLNSKCYQVYVETFPGGGCNVPFTYTMDNI